MTEFVNFELSRKLKEKGFSCTPIAMYNESGEFHSLCTSTRYRDYYDYRDFDESDFIAPTISQVLKWLREKGIHINPEISILGWYCSIHCFSKDKDGLYDINNTYLITGKKGDDYNDAVLSGLEYVLNNNLI